LRAFSTFYGNPLFLFANKSCVINRVASGRSNSFLHAKIKRNRFPFVSHIPKNIDLQILFATFQRGSLAQRRLPGTRALAWGIIFFEAGSTMSHFSGNCVVHRDLGALSVGRDPVTFDNSNPLPSLSQSAHQ
jgi:hypothetical protein